MHGQQKNVVKTINELRDYVLKRRAKAGEKTLT